MFKRVLTNLAVISLTTLVVALVYGSLTKIGMSAFNWSQTSAFLAYLSGGLMTTLTILFAYFQRGKTRTTFRQSIILGFVAGILFFLITLNVIP